MLLAISILNYLLFLFGGLFQKNQCCNRWLRRKNRNVKQSLWYFQGQKGKMTTVDGEKSRRRKS